MEGVAIVELAIPALRIDKSMRYNASNGEIFPKKAVRADVRTIYTHLTQPTEWTADRAGIDYTKPVTSRPGGIPSGRFCLAEPESRLGCPKQEEINVDQ